MPSEPSFGTYLREARERSGLSIRKAAAEADITEGRWRQLEKGYHRVGESDGDHFDIPAKPSIKTARSIARVLNLDLPTVLILAGHEKEVPPPLRLTTVYDPDDVIRAIRADSSLLPEARELLLHAYRMLQRIPASESNNTVVDVLTEAQDDLAAQPQKQTRARRK